MCAQRRHADRAITPSSFANTSTSVPPSPGALTWLLSLQWRHRSEIWQSGPLRWCTQSVKWYSQCWRKPFLGLQSKLITGNKTCHDVLMLSQNVTFLPFLKPSSTARMFSCRKWDERDAVCGTALIPRLPLASCRPRCSPINTDSITMHPTSHSRCGCSAEGKKEGEKQGERLSGRWSCERVKTWR